MSDLSSIYGHRWTPAEVAQMRRVWAVLVSHYFQQFVNDRGVVADIGAGFCHFINEVRAARKIALDGNPDIRSHADTNVEVFITRDLSLSDLPEAGVDNVFLSNFLEHLGSSDDVLALLRAVRSRLTPGGSVLILQPNFRFTGPQYFDFIDHKVVLTEKSLVEALEVTGYRVKHLVARFLPYTSKSALPRAPGLVRLYLALPLLWRVLGQQTFVVAERVGG